MESASLWKARALNKVPEEIWEKFPKRLQSRVRNKTVARSSCFLQATNGGWTDRFVDSVGSAMAKRKGRAANREFAVDLTVPV